MMEELLEPAENVLGCPAGEELDVVGGDEVVVVDKLDYFDIPILKAHG